MTIDNDKSSQAADTNDIIQTLGIDHSSNRRSRIIKWAVAAIIIVVVASVLLPWLNGGDSQTVQYKTAELTRGMLTVTVSATGTLEPVNQVKVGSEISGTIKTVPVDFNDRVKQGQVLATMDTDQLQAKVNKAKAGLELAKAQVKQAEATVRETKSSLQRAQELAKSGLCTEEDCDAAQAGYDRAEASLLSAKAQVGEAQASLVAEHTTLSKATIHSPIDGIVLDRSVEPGQTVAASLQTPVLFTLAEDLTEMELHVDVDEADVGQVKEGQAAEFTVDAYANRSFPANITEVHFASQTVEGVVTYETVLRVDNSELLLRPGMTATADIMVKQVEDALLVSNAALRFNPPAQEKKTSSGGSLVSSLMPRPPSAKKPREEAAADKKQQRVWVLRDGQAVATPVITGSTDGILTEVTGGDIEPGMAVIVDTVSAGQ